MEGHLRDLIQQSLGGTPETMLEKALEICIDISGAKGGSILGEEGPFLQFLFSNVAELIGQRVPFDSIAGVTVRSGVIIYTYAPKDKRHFDGIDKETSEQTAYLLSIPIPSIHQSASEQARRNAGALQLLFDENILGEVSPDDLPQEFAIDAFREHAPYEKHLGEVFQLLPNVAFGMEVLKLRQTSYQAIHELKNKMISALSWLEYLKEDISEKHPDLLAEEAIAQDVELTESSIREGSELAKTYLAFTRIYEPNFAPINVNDVLSEVAASAQAFGREQGLTDLQVHANLSDSITSREFDGDKLKMAFFNLCKNAVEALKDNQVENPSLTVSSFAEDKQCVITVQDNGPGMPEEIANNLFIPFKTQKEGGTGLGLTITKKIVDIHNGRIECNTGSGGTSFTIRI